LYSKCNVRQRHKNHNKKNTAHPIVSRVYPNTVGIALDTRNGKLCNCEGNIVLWMLTVVSLCCLFVSLRIEHSKYVKGKIILYFMIYDQMHLNDKVVIMTQVDGPKRHIHINFRDNGRMQDMFISTGGQVEYRHSNCEISAVRIIRATECWCHTLDSLWRVVVVMTQATLITRACPMRRSWQERAPISTPTSRADIA
jgi:hypothetical protein